MTDYYAVQYFDSLSGQGLRVYRVSEDRIEWVGTLFASNLDDLIDRLPVRVSHIPMLLTADPLLTRMLHSLLVEARDATNFSATLEEVLSVLRAVEALANVFEEEGA